MAEPPLDKFMASTLPALPGMVIVEAKPMIWAIVRLNNERAHPESVAKLMQTAHSELLQKTLDVGCNAALGVNTTITTDSSGENGSYSYIIVCQTATPVVVVPTATDLPVAVPASAPIQPYVNY